MRGLCEGLAALRSIGRGLNRSDAAAVAGHEALARALNCSAEAPLPYAAASATRSLLTASSAARTGPYTAAAPAAPSAVTALAAATSAAAASMLSHEQRRTATSSAVGPGRGPDRGRRVPPGASAPPPIRPGIIHVQSTRNNTILTLTDDAGNTKAWASAGGLGFKNARKATSYAAEAAAEKLAIDARRLGFEQVQVRVRGLGQGKQASIKTLHAAGLIITGIHECTPLPHNGCRPPKKRRV